MIDVWTKNSNHYQLKQKRQKNTPSSLISLLKAQVNSTMKGMVTGG